jgi:hypothetical protein
LFAVGTRIAARPPAQIRASAFTHSAPPWVFDVEAFGALDLQNSRRGSGIVSAQRPNRALRAGSSGGEPARGLAGNAPTASFPCSCRPYPISGVLLIDINLFFRSNDMFRTEESEAALEGLHIE